MQYWKNCILHSSDQPESEVTTAAAGRHLSSCLPACLPEVYLSSRLTELLGKTVTQCSKVKRGEWRRPEEVTCPANTNSSRQLRQAVLPVLQPLCVCVQRLSLALGFPPLILHATSTEVTPVPRCFYGCLPKLPSHQTKCTFRPLYNNIQLGLLHDRHDNGV